MFLGKLEYYDRENIQIHFRNSFGGDSLYTCKQYLGKIEYIHSGIGDGTLKRYMLAVDVEQVKLESVHLEATEPKVVHLAAVDL